jgi:hypothetical protein
MCGDVASAYAIVLCATSCGTKRVANRKFISYIHDAILTQHSYIVDFENYTAMDMDPEEWWDGSCNKDWELNERGYESEDD